MKELIKPSSSKLWSDNPRNAQLNVVELISSSIAKKKQDHAFLLAISGIDGSGKSTWTKKLGCELSRRGLNVALIGVDQWHQPRSSRFSEHLPSEHFYQHAFRWDELFNQLILPLKCFRNIYLPVQLYRIEHDEPYPHTYFFRNIDVILLEGIFLLKKEFRQYYDQAVWIDCSFETALERALQRNQEGLTQAEMIREYNTIYFPAQKLHFERDAPQLHAEIRLQSELLLEQAR